jgi:type II secretory pathway component PulJ
VSRRHDEAGFSLVEVAVASALLMIVLLPLLRFFDDAVGDAGALQQTTQLDADGRFVLDRLAREVRQAYTGDAALPPVAVTAGGSALTAYSPDTSTPFRLRRLDYRVQGGKLQRSTTSSSQTSCPDTQATCTTYGPPWSFGAAGPWVDVLDVRTGPAFTAVTVNGTIRGVDVALTASGAPGRADRTSRLSIELRNG